MKSKPVKAESTCVCWSALLVAVVGLFALPCAADVPPSPPVKANNAALWYHRGAKRIAAANLSNDQLKLLSDFASDHRRSPTPELRSVMERLQPAVTLALRGSQQIVCDFQPDFSDGPFSGFDHLNMMGRLASVVRDDFLIRLHDGVYGGGGGGAVGGAPAADRIAALYRMAQHCSSDRTILSSLVGSAIFGLADSQADIALEFGAVGPLEAAALLRALTRINVDDPFDFARALSHERQVTTQWMLDRYVGSDGLAHLSDDAERLKLPDALSRYVNRPQVELDKALKAADKALVQIIECFSMTDVAKARAQLERIEGEIKDGKHGPLAGQFLGAFIRADPARLKAKDQLRRRLDQMQAIADGRLDPRMYANAAVWYLRAMQSLEKFHSERLSQVRQYAAVHDKPPRFGLLETLTSHAAQSIIDTLREAVEIERCDFRAARPKWPTAFLPYQAGMRDLIHLLHADAARFVHADDMRSAVDRLAISFRMCSHLAPDQTVGSSLVAHMSFLRAEDLLGAAMESSLFDGGQLERLSRCTQRLNSLDPFGYSEAIAWLRRDLQPWIVKSFTGPATDEQANRARQFLGNCDGDALLWLSIVRDQSEDGSASAAQTHVRNLSSLEDVVFREGFTRAVESARVVKRHIDRGEYERLPVAGHDDIAKVVSRSAQGERDLRRCQRRFEKSAPPR
jgi:hypothetical protein